MRLPQALSHSMQSAKLPLAAIAASQMERSRRAEVRFSIRDKHEVADDRRLLLKVGFRFIDVELKAENCVRFPLLARQKNLPCGSRKMPNMPES